jgi:hypothetical protein
MSITPVYLQMSSVEAKETGERQDGHGNPTRSADLTGGGSLKEPMSKL